MRGRSFIGLEAVDFAHAGESTADVGNGDGATDDEGDVEGVNDFFSGPAFFRAADEMVRDAVVAAENGGSRRVSQAWLLPGRGQ